MSKLSDDKKFLDVSDYGRYIAITLAKRLKNSKITPIHITVVFGICGLVAVYCILNQYYLTAGCFLILKSIIDALDGELSRVKNTPSYTGRYLDSVFDIILNFLFLLAVSMVAQANLWLTLSAFICFQLQGTLYNYYYVIIRNNSAGGDATSKIFETIIPKALPGESQKSVNVLFTLYLIFYRIYDSTIYALDRKAAEIKSFPNWFMNIVSIYGLGFQLLIMAVFLAFKKVEIIIPFFIAYSVFMIVIIGIRRIFLTKNYITKLKLPEVLEFVNDVALYNEKLPASSKCGRNKKSSSLNVNRRTFKSNIENIEAHTN